MKMIDRQGRRWLWLLIAAMLLTGCRRQRLDMEVANSVYYWRTNLRLDSMERAFIGRYQTEKMYCRYFDVVMSEQGEPRPNATLSFSDTLPGGVSLIPTVYITEDCMHQWHEGLAEKIVGRIRQMNETNDIPAVTEIQMDCDYTGRSRKTYYRFLEAVARAWHGRLSATIRLHQLSMDPPPVDYGVLMLYNTGDPRNYAERNPILDYRDVAPYLKRLDGYDLPLAAAYPVYQWVRNIGGVRVEHHVEADEILRVKRAVEEERDELRHTIITYHLDKDNINRYTPETYEEIYRH